jgi:internalin A
VNEIKGILPLQGLTNLSVLGLSFNGFRDISPLCGKGGPIQTEEEEGVQDEAIESPKGLTNLVELDLSFNEIDDLSPLEKLTRLRKLFLGQNKILDLTPLETLKDLEQLTLENNRLSQTQLDTLRAAIPKANIDF